MIAYKLDLVMLVLLPHDCVLLVDPGKFFCSYCRHFCGLCKLPIMYCVLPLHPMKWSFALKGRFFNCSFWFQHQNEKYCSTNSKIFRVSWNVSESHFLFSAENRLEKLKYHTIEFKSPRAESSNIDLHNNEAYFVKNSLNFELKQNVSFMFHDSNWNLNR